MIKYYCNTCGKEVSSLSELADLSSKCSADSRADHYFVAAFEQLHVCKTCIHAIKNFITTLRSMPSAAPTAPASVSDSVQ